MGYIFYTFRRDGRGGGGKWNTYILDEWVIDIAMDINDIDNGTGH